MKRDPLKASVLAAKIIPNASPEMLKDFDNIPENYKSLALITADSDDVTYTALDEATKKIPELLFFQEYHQAYLCVSVCNQIPHPLLL